MEKKIIREGDCSALTDVTRRVDERVKQHPYGTLAAAVGIGYVLGGGLFTRLTARLLRLGLAVGLPLTVSPLVKKELTSLTESLVAERAARATHVQPRASATDAE
jgi:hypothetical protein